MPHFTDKRATTTSLIVAALQERDDFMNQAQLVAATGCSRNRVSAALAGLHRYKAVDCIEVQGAQLWWYLTPDQDTRLRTFAEVKADIKRPRKRKPLAPS